MKTKVQKLALLAATFASGLLLAASTARATNYAGNGNTGFGGPVGNGVLSVTDDHTNITINLQRGSSGNLNDALVVYIDTGAGGYADTASLTDTSGYEQKAISGYDGSNRSLMVFTNGFRPSYAVVFKSDYVDVWNISSPSGFSYKDGAGGFNSSSANFTLTFPASDIGLTTNVSSTIRLFGTLLNPNGAYRSTEAIAGNDVASAFGQGPNPFTNTVFATYNFSAPAAPTNPVTFSVDMTAQVASSVFDPGNGDTVYVGGSFESTPFAFSLQLTNDPNAANTNIYSGTYPDQNSTNTIEQYKFKFYSLANAVDTYDADPNRTFMLQGGGQQVPLIYFNNTPADPSATTNIITLQIDMGPQIYLGHFDPSAGDVVEVFGGFQVPQFSGLILTNDPNAQNTNIYTAVIEDHNYPGTQYLPAQNGYKYAIITTALTTNYESGANRSLVTPTNSATFPVDYFNNLSTYGAVPITFQVDMTLPLAMGMFDPSGRGDTVSAAGTFQTNIWTAGGFVLTNDPSGANPNIYSGTYTDRNAPGSVEYYKFQINTNGGDVAWESISDRAFQLGTAAATLPLVNWNNASTNNVILEPTLVTFSVDMAGAVDVFGNPFDAGNDAVMVDGNYYSPGWDVMNNATYENPLVFTDHVMTQVGSSSIYTNSFLAPAGTSYQIIYKYGIYHDTANFNTNVDNEAAAYVNHTRYIRSVPVYNFPVDTFGQQRTNEAAATEIPFGNLAISAPTGGNFPISWLGLPSVRLQSCTNLASPDWQDVDGTKGMSATNWPTTGDQRFFRLLQPQ